MTDIPRTDTTSRSACASPICVATGKCGFSPCLTRGPDHIANPGKVIEPDPDLTTYLRNIAGWLDYRNLGATADKIREAAARIRTLGDDVVRLTNQYADAESQLERAREALEPFAEVVKEVEASHGPEYWPEDATPLRGSLAYPISSGKLRWSHFLAARLARGGG